MLLNKIPHLTKKIKEFIDLKETVEILIDENADIRKQIENLNLENEFLKEKLKDTEVRNEEVKEILNYTTENLSFFDKQMVLMNKDVGSLAKTIGDLYLTIEQIFKISTTKSSKSFAAIEKNEGILSDEELDDLFETSIKEKKKKKTIH